MYLRPKGLQERVAYREDGYQRLRADERAHITLEFFALLIPGIKFVLRDGMRLLHRQLARLQDLQLGIEVCTLTDFAAALAGNGGVIFAVGPDCGGIGACLQRNLRTEESQTQA